MTDPNVKLSEYIDNFEHVRQLEYNEVRRRRRMRAGGAAEDSRTDSPTPPALYGVALSGGGIRSASFCLGALQALHSKGLAEPIDYLSTVSGGGYVGASMISAMQQNGGKFPFASGPTDRHDNEPISHLRDNSRFLAPNGGMDFLISAAVVLRGLLVNFVLVLAMVLPVSIILIVANPAKADLGRSVILDLVRRWGPASWQKEPIYSQIYPYLSDQFILSKALALALLFLLFCWAIQRAFTETRASPTPEQVSRGARWGSGLLIALAAALFLELQPPILLWAMNGLEAQSAKSAAASETRATITGTVGTLAAALVALAATFQNTLVGWIKKALGSPTIKSRLKALFAQTLIYTAGLILPFAIYGLFLMITLWGIKPASCASSVCDSYAFTPGFLPIANGTALWWLSFLVLTVLLSVIAIRSGARTWWHCALAVLGSVIVAVGLFQLFLRAIHGLDFSTWRVVDVLLLNAAVVLVCKFIVLVLFPADIWHHWYTPLLEVVTKKKRATTVIFMWASFLGLSSIATRSGPASDGVTWTVLWFFTAAMLLVWLIGSRFTGNANGMHRLYRDRLSAAFRLSRPGNEPLRLSDMSGNSPYLLVNATLNASVIAAREDTNAISNPGAKRMADPARRGRNADFFMFSSLFTGSDLTGYCDTREIEGIDRQLDLATAVAISGAAVSSSMGRIRIGLLGPTLALLNLKLGYWLTNPRLLDPGYAFSKERQDSWSDRLRLYLFTEALGRLRTNSARVYVTDGGHIDNIGLYQLLKRRCKYVVVIDGEADPGMTFSAFSDLQRFARIDDGVLVTLNWMPIRDAALARMADRTKQTASNDAAHDQHFAVGKILYQEKDGETEEGLLVYIKASVTGDEPDYVLDYERRHPLFPHESTGDQFFSEEQMEAYRALGYHCVARCLNSERQDKTANAKRGKTGPIGQMMQDLRAARVG